MNNDKTTLYFIIGVVAFTILLVIGGIFLIGGDSSSNMTENENAAIEVEGIKTHDWGDIDINGGVVEKTFKVKNTGSGDLEITDFVTSCMCTTVQVNINGQSSPVFDMHSKSSWVGSIPEGSEAEISVVFDPMFHGPTGTGPITRTVKFETNDSANSIIEFKLTGTVI